MRYLTLIGALMCTIIIGHGQSVWYEVPSGTNKELLTIDFPSGSVGYIGGKDSLLLKTIDGGVTWNEMAPSGMNLSGQTEINNLKFITEDVGYASVGDFGGIYKTVDGGQNWSQVTLSGGLCVTTGMYFWGEDDGIIGGAGCFIGEQLDVVSPSGTTAATVNSPGWGSFENLVVDIDFLNANYGLAASLGGRILRTIDGGFTWDTIATGWGSLPVKSIEIIDDTSAHLSFEGSMSGFTGLRTHDKGTTWFQDGLTFGSPNINDLHHSGDGRIWGGGSEMWGPGGTIFERSEDGSWWMSWYVRDTVNAMDSYNDSIVWAVGDSGMIVVNDDLGVLGITSPERKPLTVYPNPATSNVWLSIPETIIEVRLYTLTGQQVYHDNNGNTQLDISHLKSGIYLMEVLGTKNRYSSKLVKE